MTLDWTGPARADIQAIDVHLSQYSPERAARLLEAILATADILEAYPAIGPALDEATRSLRVRHSPYILLYRIRQPVVQILRVRHEREDWRTI